MGQDYGTGLVFEPFELYSSLPDSSFIKSERRLNPPRVDLSESMPIPGYQGKQGSCVAFSSAYTVRSYQEFQERKNLAQEWNSLNQGDSINPKTVFSPAYVYNSLNKGKDNGITYFEALSFLTTHGVVPWEYMPYDPKNFLKKPDKKLEEIAGQYLAKEFRKVRFQDIDEIKSHLADGHPIMTGIIISSNLLDLKSGEIYKAHSGKSMGGHAVTLVGYDDSKEAFLFMNSWGTAWADKGFGWIDYKWYLKTAKVAYILVDEIAPLSLSRGEVAVNLSAEGFDKSRKQSPPVEVFATQGNYSDKVVLTWAPVEGALGYEIYRSLAEEENFQKIGISKTSNFHDTGVQVDVAYHYKISSIFEFGISSKTNSSIVGYASPVKKETPPKLAGLRATKGKYSDRIRIEWEALDSGITGYQIFKWDSRLQTYRSIAKVKANWYEDKTAAKSGVVETYTVSAINGNIIGTTSDAVTGRTSLGQRPEAPLDVVASSGVYSDRVQIKWRRVPTAIEYLIYRYEDKKWVPMGTTTKEEYWDESPGKDKRFYTVVAKNKDMEWGDFSDFALGYADTKLKRSGSRLAPPQNFTARLLDRTIYLDWESVQGATEYTIWLKRAGERNWIFWGKVEGENRTSFLSSLPDNDVLYLFSVTARNEEGTESHYSEIGSVVYSEAKKAPTRRAFAKSSKVERIKGTWTGLFWDGSNEAKNFVMKIEPLDENTVKVSIDNKKTYEGKFIQESPEIELEGKVKIRIPNFTTLAVELKDKAIIKDPIEVSFLRE